MDKPGTFELRTGKQNEISGRRRNPHPAVRKRPREHDLEVYANGPANVSSKLESLP
jgi:hypothetical protein